MGKPLVMSLRNKLIGAAVAALLSPAAATKVDNISHFDILNTSGPKYVVVRVVFHDGKDRDFHVPKKALYSQDLDKVSRDLFNFITSELGRE